MRWWVFVLCFFSANIQQTSWNLCCCNLLQTWSNRLIFNCCYQFLKTRNHCVKDSAYSDLCNRQEHFYYRKSKCWCIVLASELLVNNHTDKWLPYLIIFLKKQYEITKGMSLLDVGLNMKLKIKLQKGMKWLENDSMHLCSSWENFILTWRWVLFSSDKA